jgi:hypothetical protein
MIDLIRSPWGTEFTQLVGEAQTSLVVCAPFVGKGPCGIIVDRIRGDHHPSLELTVLTDLSRENILRGATDPQAILGLKRACDKTEIRFLPSLHAKVYVADERRAIITSGNLTDSGLHRNYEYGVRVSSSDSVRQIRSDILAYAALGSPIDEERLADLARVAEEMRELQRALEKSMRRKLRTEFERRLREVDDEILRVRASGRTAHAIFAEAILYLLRDHPLSTEQIHEGIRRIHPDLCDDSLDRVIDGRHFGKLWKHAVRTAQVFLRRRGDIRLQNGKWGLSS